MRYIIENEEIGLSRTSYEQIEKICEMESSPDNCKFLAPYVKSKHLQIIDDINEEHLSIWDKKTCKLLGYAILSDISNPNLSIGLKRIVINDKKKGYGKQSVELIENYCFEKLNSHRIWLDVFEDNDRGIKLFKSMKFQEEGKLRDVIKQQDAYRTRVILSILRN